MIFDNQQRLLRNSLDVTMRYDHILEIYYTKEFHGVFEITSTYENAVVNHIAITLRVDTQ